VSIVHGKGTGALRKTVRNDALEPSAGRLVRDGEPSEVGRGADRRRVKVS